MPGKISVCIPVYNGEKFIEEQLRSILNQLRISDEVVISDDVSTDNTLTIIHSLKDPRVKILSGKKFGGPIRNLENALGQAAGDIIFLSDQDDIWEAGKVSTVLHYLQKYDLVVTDCKVVNESLETIHPSYFELFGSQQGILNNLISNTYIGCCMAFKRQVLDIALPFPPKIPMHDFWLGFVAELFFKPVFVKEQLLLYRRHTNNKSATTQKSPYSLLQKLKFRWNIIKYAPNVMVRYLSQYTRRSN